VQFECKSTGVLFTSSYEDGQYASEVAPGLGAPITSICSAPVST
jgi:hypothetical protein